MGSAEKIIAGIKEGLNESVSGAIHQSIGELAHPIQDLKNIADTSSKKTEELSNKLVFWTKVMAFAIIGQILAVVGQIIAIIWTNSN